MRDVGFIPQGRSMSLNKGQNEQAVLGIQWRIYVCCSPSWTYFLEKAVFVATAFMLCQEKEI